ncbi:MAG TPA: hypothetical protein VHE12_04435 [bacterium]|nr:hypothetical protein [bacterium]
MRTLLILAGLGNLGLALASIAIPHVLKWSIDMKKMRPLTRQIFQTYAIYIWATNLSFGLLSLFHPEWLLDGSPLARAVAGFITLYWGARLMIQFFYYDQSVRPPGTFWMVAEWSLVGLFVYLTGVYGHIALTGG